MNFNLQHMCVHFTIIPWKSSSCSKKIIIFFFRSGRRSEIPSLFHSARISSHRCWPWTSIMFSLDLHLVSSLPASILSNFKYSFSAVAEWTWNVFTKKKKLLKFLNKIQQLNHMMSEFDSTVRRFWKNSNKKNRNSNDFNAFICSRKTRTTRLNKKRVDETFYEYVKLGTSPLFTVTDCSPDFLSDCCDTASIIWQKE